MLADIYTQELYCLNCGGDDLASEGSYPSGDKFICRECNEVNWAVKSKE